MERTWYLYIVRTLDQCLYTGIATDVKRRYAEHLSHTRKTAKFLLAHKPKRLVFSQKIGERSLALKVEYRFKQLTRKEKMKRIQRKRIVFDTQTGAIAA